MTRHGFPGDGSAEAGASIVAAFGGRSGRSCRLGSLKDGEYAAKPKDAIQNKTLRYLLVQARENAVSKLAPSSCD
ncbi:hypothetical protein P3T36_007632 [Kitasatospora sp. MAP12-15]|nr:hypothetical protein [Kitasatospora sp. MAP12-44]